VRSWPLTLRGTGAVVLALAAFVLAHEFAVTELLYVSVLLLAAVAVSVATLYIVRRTERVSRSFVPDVASAGDDVVVRARVEIRTPLPTAQGTWSDELPPGIVGDARGAFPAVGSDVRRTARAVDLSYTVHAERRGIRQVGPLTVTSTDPFGFARRRHTIGGRVELTVAPRVLDLDALDDLPGEAGGSMHTATDQLGQGTDNLIPRHYIPGDSMRRIHWRASAHRDELMVRQEEQETTPDAIVMLDRGMRRWSADAARAPGGDPAFEAAVTACVSVAARLVREGYVVSVVGADGSPLADPIDGGDGEGVRDLAVDFATLTAYRDVEPAELARLFHGAQTGPLVLITGRIDAADADALASVASHSSLPIVLAVAPQQGALLRLAEAGWRTAAIPPHADLAGAWADATDRGLSRARA
jgi:uncharacterized protein (DUF58 family)